jgi:5-oxoprolinase (ATP-hydrolysing)
VSNLQATVLPEHLIIDKRSEESVTKIEISQQSLDNVDPVLLSVYGHRLMGIAEQVSPSYARQC